MLRFFVEREISATIGKSQLQTLGKSQVNFWFPGNFDSVTGKKTLFPCPTDGVFGVVNYLMHQTIN